MKQEEIKNVIEAIIDQCHIQQWEIAKVSGNVSEEEEMQLDKDDIKLHYCCKHLNELLSNGPLFECLYNNVNDMPIYCNYNEELPT